MTLQLRHLITMEALSGVVGLGKQHQQAGGDFGNLAAAFDRVMVVSRPGN